MAIDPYIVMRGFTVPAPRQREFVNAFGPAGAWSRLFQRAEGYRGTELYRDRADSERFVMVTFWLSPQAHSRFREAFAVEARALDNATSEFTGSSTAIGEFGLADLSQSAI